MVERIVGATHNRQVLGSMNDFKNMMPFYVEGQSLLEASLKLAGSPCSPIGMESPLRATLSLFGRLESRPTGPALRLVKG
jgi:hypothetical protein